VARTRKGLSTKIHSLRLEGRVDILASSQTQLQQFLNSQTPHIQILRHVKTVRYFKIAQVCYFIRCHIFK